MSLYSELQAHAAEAQGVVAQMQGMGSAADGNTIGPDGRTYTLSYGRAGIGSASEMVGHGYNDRSTIIATATRDQFAAPPLDWRRKKLTRLVPAPATEATVANVDTDDPLHYVFVLLLRQPAP